MGTQLPQRKEAQQPPTFRPMSIVPNGWMDQDTTWYGGRPWPRPHCVRWGPGSSGKGHSSPPLFGPCLLWPYSRPSQQLLSYCVLIWVGALTLCTVNRMGIQPVKTSATSSEDFLLEQLEDENRGGRELVNPVLPGKRPLKWR